MAANHLAIEHVAKRIHDLYLSHPTRVAVDGRTASGKTTFADALAAIMQQYGRHVIRASVDGFHRPRAERHRRGRLSPDGYYEDARDLHAMRQLLLDPLGPGGDRNYLTASLTWTETNRWRGRRSELQAMPCLSSTAHFCSGLS